MKAFEYTDRFPLGETQQCITHRFRAQVANYPNEIALQTPNTQLSYQDLDQLSDRYARGLIAAGLKPQDRVVLFLEQGCEQIAAILAVIKCCAIYIPLQARDSIPQLKATLLDADPLLLLCDLQNKALANLLVKTHQRVVSVVDVQASDQIKITFPEGNPNHLVYVYYTSGTTGKPKGVMDNHRNVLHNIRRYSNSLKISRSDKLTLFQSCEFSGAVSNIFTALLNGAVLLPIDLHQLGIRAAASWLNESGATIYHSVPSIFRQVLKSRLQFPSLRIVRLEGDSAVLEDIHLFQSIMPSHCKLLHGLGTTETGIIAQYSIDTDTDLVSPTVPLGHALSEMSISIVDLQGGQLPQGVVGEIVVTSDYLACGYRNQDALTQKKFMQSGKQRTYFTGDLGWVTFEGLLHYAGRTSERTSTPKTHAKDDSSLSQSLASIENEISQLPGVEACLALEVTEAPSGAPRYVDAYVEQDGSCRTDNLLIKLFALDAGDERLIVKYVLIDTIPKTSTGKIDRKFMRGGSSRISMYLAPRSSAEQRIVEAFQKALGKVPLGVNANFFELGGTSLGAAELAVELGQFYAFELVLGALQHSATPVAMAEILEKGLGNNHLVALQPHGNEPTVFCVHAHMGHVYNLRALATRFASNTPFYGIQLMADSPPLENTVDCFAGHYLQHITKHFMEKKVECSSGQIDRFQLSGYCFGAWVAVEMGRQLQRYSLKPATLLLIDPELPGFPTRTRGMPIWHSRLLGTTKTNILIRIKSLTRRLSNRLKQSYWLAADAFGFSHLIPTLKHNPEFKCYIADYYYQPRPYSGPVQIYVPHEEFTRDRTMRWHKWFTGELKIIPVYAKKPALLREPAARQLADEIFLNQKAQ